MLSSLLFRQEREIAQKVEDEAGGGESKVDEKNCAANYTPRTGMKKRRLDERETP